MIQGAEPFVSCPFQVFGIAFSIIGVLPSIASVLFYAIPSGGGPAMVWGVSSSILPFDTDIQLFLKVARCKSLHFMRWYVDG